MSAAMRVIQACDQAVAASRHEYLSHHGPFLDLPRMVTVTQYGVYVPTKEWTDLVFAILDLQREASNQDSEPKA